MKRLLLFLCLFAILRSEAQNNPVAGIIISLPQNPDPIIANWKGGASLLTISATARAVNGRPDVRVEGSRILVIIKKAGGKVCGSFTNSSAPAANFTTLNKVWSGNNAVSLLGQECTLPPGEYELTVQLFANGPTSLEPISEEKIKSFTIKGNEQQTYQPPQPMLPTNGIIFKEDEIKKPVTFRWTPVVPRPQEPVTYRLRVWRMAEGQNSIPATIIQQPILGNDVGNVTQVIVRLHTPPPNQNTPEVYVWNVQALNRDGKPIGSNNGTSEAFTINVQPVNDPPVAVKLTAPANKSSFAANDKLRFSWTINNINSPVTHYKLKITEILLNQSPYDALRTNKPHFEKDSLKEQSFTATSSFTAGKKYAWLIEAKGERGIKITESEINEFIISTTNVNDSRLSLVSPANDAVVDENPLFSWTPFVGDYTGDGYYRIKIVEIIRDQSPEQAFKGNKPFFEKDSLLYFKGNKPHFEKDSLKLVLFRYPSSAPRLEAGKKYAWNVQALKRDRKPMAASAINRFAVRGEIIPISPSFACPMADPRPFFEWNGARVKKSKNSFYKIRIAEMDVRDSTMEAFDKRKTIAVFDRVPGDTLKYGESMPKLEMRKLYGWQVTLYENGTLIGKSEAAPFYIVDYKFPFNIKEALCCTKNLVQNGTFEIQTVNGDLGKKGSSSDWQKGYGNPVVVSKDDGCNSPGYISLNGNKKTGSCITQTLQAPKIQQGKHYRFSACIRLSEKQKSADYVYIKVLAFNGSLPSSGTHPTASTDIANIGWSGKILQKDWITFSLNVWTANKNFDNIAIYCFTASDDTTTYCDIDNICLQETTDPRSCDDYAYSANGQPIIDPSLTATQQNVVTTLYSENNGLVSDLYSSYGNTDLDNWYPLNDDCASIGGTIPESVTNLNFNDTLIQLGLPGGTAQLDSILSQQYADTSLQDTLTPIPTLRGTCPAFVPDNNLPFSGRDIIFVHGLQLKHLCDKNDGVAGAQKKWPADKTEFYGGGYYKSLADVVWADHIQTWLRSKGYKNRVLVVSYNCSQRADVAAHAVLSQIREAMNSGTGVEFVQGDKRGKECFGRDAVIISHSTGGPVTDIAMSIAQKSKTNLLVQARFGNVGFIADNIKAHVAMQGAFSGSNMATIYLAVQKHVVPAKFLNDGVCHKLKIPSLSMLLITHQSILIDLQPYFIQSVWGPLMSTTPVPVITIAGGHPYGVDKLGFANWAIHPGLNDGVLTMSSQIGNPNFETASMPTGYFHTPSLSYKIYDMGISMTRAYSYYASQKLFAPPGYAGSSGGSPFYSATGMLQPVMAVNPFTNPFNRYPNHYSFLQSASDHYIGPRGKSINEGFDPLNPAATTGFVPPCYDYDQSFTQNNNEESRCITDASIYTMGLVSQQMQTMQYERTKGLYIDFDVYGPQFSVKCCWKFKFWWGPMFHVRIPVWERKYHNMVGFECESEVSYMYKYVLRN